MLPQRKHCKNRNALLLKQFGTCLALEIIAIGVDSTGVTDRDKHAAKPSNKHSGIILLPPKVFLLSSYEKSWSVDKTDIYGQVEEYIAA